MLACDLVHVNILASVLGFSALFNSRDILMPTKFSSKLDVYIIFFASLLLFTCGLSTQEIIGFDSRFYLFAQEMLRYGMGFFPETYHHPYPDYPASSTVMVYLFSHLFGGLNKLIAVLPTAIMAALTVSFTSLIGSLHNKHWGYCAAMMVLLTSAFVKSARAMSLDMYPVLMCTICFYLIYSADIKNKPRRTIWIYPLLLLGFIFRGPIGLVMPAGIIFSYYAINKNWRSLFLKSTVAFLLLCFCTAALLLLAYHVGGDSFMHDVMRMEVLGRIDNPYLPRYFYWTNSFGSYALSYPLAWLVLFFAAYYAYRKDFFADKIFLLQLFGWMMVILIGMSVPDDKKVRYILPMVPAIALLAAYPFVAPLSQRYFVSLRTFLRKIFLVFPLIFLILTIITQYYLDQHLSINIDFDSIMNVFLLLQIASSAASYFISSLELREKIVISIAAFCFIFATITIIEPIQLHIDKARDFVLATELSRIETKSRLIFYKESPDGLPIKYLINKMSDDQPGFIQDLQELLRVTEPAYFVTSESNYVELTKNMAVRFRVIASDTMGHVRVVVFVKKE